MCRIDQISCLIYFLVKWARFGRGHISWEIRPAQAEKKNKFREQRKKLRNKKNNCTELAWNIPDWIYPYFSYEKTVITVNNSTIDVHLSHCYTQVNTRAQLIAHSEISSGNVVSITTVWFISKLLFPYTRTGEKSITKQIIISSYRS